MQENNDKSNMLLLGKISKKSLIRAGKKKANISVEIAKTREETITIDGRIEEKKGQSAVFNCIAGLRLRKELLP